jgi:hypothetical protein
MNRIYSITVLVSDNSSIKLEASGESLLCASSHDGKWNGEREEGREEGT